MRRADYILRDWRYRVIEPYVPHGCTLVDIGGYDGSLLTRLHGKIKKGVCIDPLIEEKREGKIELIRYEVTDRLPFPDSYFDVATMLAVYEHLGDCREAVVLEVSRVLRVGGLALLTVPDSSVDRILKVMIRLHLLDGMSLEEHRHSDYADTIKTFGRSGFKLLKWAKFQLGLNNLFVFEKAGSALS